jgi:hypothetical protein
VTDTDCPNNVPDVELIIPFSTTGIPQSEINVFILISSPILIR